MTSSKDFFVNLEWVWRFSKLSPNSLQTRSKLICFHFFCFMFFYIILFLKKRNEFGVSSEILQTLSKLICFHFFVIYFFGQEEWVWSEFGDSPNWLQIRSKLICFHFFCFIFFGKRGMSLEWVWGFSLGILQTHPKLKWFLFFSVCVSLYCYLKHFLEREEWVWSKFGGSSNSLQTRSKLIWFHFAVSSLLSTYCFHSFRYLYCIFFKKKEWIWRFPKVSPISLRALVATPLGPEITYSGPFFFFGTYQINLVHAYHPERLSFVQVISWWFGIFYNILYFSIYWETYSQLTNIFQRGWNHQPDVIGCWFPIHVG